MVKMIPVNQHLHVWTEASLGDQGCATDKQREETWSVPPPHYAWVSKPFSMAICLCGLVHVSFGLNRLGGGRAQTLEKP